MNTQQKSPNLKKYHSKNPVQQFVIKIFLRSIAKEVKNLPVQEILDVGCGEGLVIKHLNKEIPSKNFFGIDFSYQAIENARSINPNVKFRVGDATNLDLDDNSYDLILLLEVLEHLNNPKEALAESKRVTNKYCLISVPWEPFFSWANFLRGRYIKRFGKNPEHIQLWSMKRIKKLVGQYYKIEKAKIIFPWILILARKK